MRHSYSSKDIAKMAGVSRSTVSKVLGNYPGISPGTREKVLSIIEQVGYFPNLSAQALTGKNKRVIGLFLIHNEQPGFNYTPSILALLALCVYNVASRAGYQVLNAAISEDGSNLTEIVDLFTQGHVDAGIFQAHTLTEPLIRELKRQNQIVGVLDGAEETAHKLGVITSNIGNYDCARRVIDYLYSLGHRDIAVVVGDKRWNTNAERERGFLDGIKSFGLKPILPIIPDDCEDDGYIIIRKILDGGRIPTAVACGYDGQAHAVIDVLLERGFRIPEDISVVGIENNPLSNYLAPPLTTFRFEIENWISFLIQNILVCIENKEKTPEYYKVFGGTLVERSSCAPPRGNP